jgi:hypothetical protein
VATSSIACGSREIFDRSAVFVCVCSSRKCGEWRSRILGSTRWLVSSRTGSQFIVIGFLGGFVSNDEPHHPEVHMIQTPRQQYPNDVYFGAFENSMIEEAYELILNRLDVNRDGALSNDEKRQASIELFGQSWGAAAVIALSRRLDRRGIPVQLTVQVDSIRKPFDNDRVIPSNILQAANFYQTRGLIHGQSKIVAADPSHTNPRQFSLGPISKNLSHAVISPGMLASSPKRTLRSNVIRECGHKWKHYCVASSAMCQGLRPTQPI